MASPTTDQLVSDLAGLAPADYYLDGDRYFDWTPDSPGAVTDLIFEVGVPGRDVQVAMTRDELLGLQQRLTAWLIATR